MIGVPVNQLAKSFLNIKNAFLLNTSAESLANTQMVSNGNMQMANTLMVISKIWNTNSNTQKALNNFVLQNFCVTKLVTAP